MTEAEKADLSPFAFPLLRHIDFRGFRGFCGSCGFLEMLDFVDVVF